MVLDAEMISTLGGLVLALIGQGVALFKWLDSRMENQIRELSSRISEEVSSIKREQAAQVIDFKRSLAAVNERINQVKDTYTKQEAHDKDHQALQQSLREFRSEVKADQTNAMALYNAGLRDLQSGFVDLLKDRG